MISPPRRSTRLPVLPVVAAAVLVFGLTIAAGRAMRRPPDGAADVPRPASQTGDTMPAAAEDVPPATGDVVHTIAPGDTLSGVAASYGTTVEAIMDQNGLRDADAIFVGQSLVVRSIPRREGPAVRSLPDGAFVLGPATIGFDVRAFLVAGLGGEAEGEAESRDRGQGDDPSVGMGPGLAVSGRSRLLNHTELVDAEVLDGAAMVERVAREFSIDPRVLLAFVEARSGWVTGGPAPDPASADFAAGLIDPARQDLWLQLNWLADRLNGGYYDWKTRDNRSLTLADGTRLAGHSSLGPASFAVHRALALQSTEPELEARLADFDAAYRALFGDPWRQPRPGLDVSSIDFPALELPFERGETWWITGGPHGGWGDGSAWASLDFVPDEDARGCFVSTRWATAVADGVVVEGGAGQVWLDLDGDGVRQTGPVVLYLHLAAEDRVAPGTRVKAGDRVGRPSCEGGFSNATHLHIARLYDGEWLAAAGDVPFEFGAWRAFGSPSPYDGGLVGARGVRREACECRLEDHNDVVR